jgi:flagellin
MSFSVVTNNNAMAALYTLNQTNQAMSKVQAQINSGLKVANASDNASTFSIAQTMRGDIASFKSVNDALSLGSSTVNVAQQAAKQISDTLNQIKGKVADAMGDNVNRTAIKGDIDSMLDAIDRIAGSAQFNGVNLLNGDYTVAAPFKILASFDRNATTGGSTGDPAKQTVDVTGYDLTTATLGIAKATLTVDTAAHAQTSLTTINGVIDTVNAALDALGTKANEITGQQSFVQNLTNTMTDAVGSLVDADMAEASAQLQSLQTKQQLGIQALSIANSAPSAILSLFRG